MGEQQQGAGHGVFERLVPELDTPMYIVTAARGDERDGCLLGFASQCSIDPPQFVVWLSKNNRTYRIAGQGVGPLVVHLVRDNQFELAQWFGGETGDEVDKLARISWRPGPGGAPVIEGCDWFAGRVISRVDAGGDHEGFVLGPFDGGIAHDGAEPLGLQRAKEIDPGHEA